MRYFRLYLNFLRFSISKQMHFRVDFWLRFGMDLIFYGVNLAFFKIIYLQTPTIGDWTEEMAIVFVAGFLVVDALRMTFLSNNMWHIPFAVNSGDLDYYLLRPVSSLFFLSLRDFALNSFLNLLVAFGFLTWALNSYSGELSAFTIFCFIALLINGAFLYYIVRLIMIIPVFWAHSTRGFDQVFFAMGQLTDKPDVIFRGLTRTILISILPLCLIASFPARVIFEGPSFALIGYVFLVTILLSATALYLWHMGLKAYSSASS